MRQQNTNAYMDRKDYVASQILKIMRKVVAVNYGFSLHLFGYHYNLFSTLNNCVFKQLGTLLFPVVNYCFQT